MNGHDFSQPVMGVRELQGMEEVQKALYLISETANSALNLEAVYRSIHKIIDGLIPAKNFFIALYDENEETIDFPYYVDEFNSNAGKRKCKKGLTEYVIKTGQPLLVSSLVYIEMLERGEAETIGKPAIDWMGIPLKNAENKVIGGLVVQTYTEGNRYTQKDQDILSFVSTQVAMVIERKRIEEALRESEEQYRAIVENSHDAIYIFSENRIVYANQNLCTLLEVTSKEIEKINVLEYIHLEDKIAVYQYIEKQNLGKGTTTSSSSSCEARVISTKGNVKFIELNLNKILYKGKEAYLWAISDITERKAAEKLQQALYLISETVNSSLDLEKLYSSVHEIIGKLILAENFFIAIYDKNLDTVTFPYHVDEKDKNPGPRKNGNGLTEYVIRTGQAVFVSEADHDHLIEQGTVENSGVLHVNWLGVPLRTSDDEVFGVLGVKTHKDSAPYTQKDKDILSFVSNQVAMAIKRKQDETRLQYLSFRDSLSGLYNRRYFEEEMRRMDQRRFGSVGLIVLDVDGLKLVNDMFGHDSGDKLLFNVATLLTSCFREEDVIARIGGDEYSILLHDANEEVVQAACERLNKRTLAENVDNNHPPLSLSIGFAVSDDPSIPMSQLFKQADSNMYREKLARGKNAHQTIVQTVLKLLEERDFITEGHGDRMQKIVASIGEKCGLTLYELSDLCLFAQFHDVGKIGIMNSILLKPGKLTEEELKEMQGHSEIGHRIARSTPDLRPIADLILKHHEWWNGEGYPLGLAGTAIPLACRILAIADAYDAMTSDRPYRKAIGHEEAVAELRRYAGIQFDPELVKIFT